MRFSRRTVCTIALLLAGVAQILAGENEGVEVVKAVAPEQSPEKREDTDQVAQETVDQEGAQSLLFAHGPPPPSPPNGPAAPQTRNAPHLGPFGGIGQPFGHAHPGAISSAYHGPPPPPPPQGGHPGSGPGAIIPHGLPSGNDLWAAPSTDMPKIISLDVKCEKGGMKVFIQFDQPFFGIVFSKGHYSNINCVHLPTGSGRTSAQFNIGLHECGTAGNTENGHYGLGTETGSGTFFENIIVVQYDPQVQEVWDQARKLRCTWHDQYEKSVTFRPFPVDMLDVIRADFAGDNVGCWMQIQVGKGPWASEVSGLVKIGQTMTMVLAIKDDDSKFDMLVRNCVAHDGKRAPIQLVDQRGCVTRPKLMSRFTKIKNFGSSASVLSYAHFQAFKFPDSMEVHFQCTIQICRYQCPEQCSDPLLDVHHLSAGPEHQYGPPPPQQLQFDGYLAQRKRDERRYVGRRARSTDPEKEIGLNRVIRVVSSGDLTFPIDSKNGTQETMVFPLREEGLICMTTPGFAVTLIVLLGILIVSCLLSAFLCVRLRPFSFGGPSEKEQAVAFTNPTLSPAAVATLSRMTARQVAAASSMGPQAGPSSLPAQTQPKRRFCFYPASSS